MISAGERPTWRRIPHPAEWRAIFWKKFGAGGSHNIEQENQPPDLRPIDRRTGMHFPLFLTGENCLATADLARAGTSGADDRGFDAAIRRKLEEIEPPTGLRDAILAQGAAALGISPGGDV